jgi:energy-coupling factor transporter ATP-binding protein EcfA2
MKVIDTICPYTGLRSFTEDESLYFKGRDQQVDQITSLLEKNKFLMVTGASGEGKSSLVFAGLIPNARAGFFKAKYTNWVVADFRPERNPVVNMAESIAQAFDRQPATVETELRRGFSSMIDLYTNSPYYHDELDPEWQALSDEEQRRKKRDSANLMILVDQFEEFFTNPENFHNQAPSEDAQIVVNLILETARLALKRNLPVYVVCTMRSDYVGQCSAFRGLPEYIGFSQFFVPRLKRKDLKQVIEEPATLSGNTITQRLVERLVYDIAEGVDQLPILQHALSQIWLAADHGLETLDLIHYAMVGGMSPEDLPDEDRQRFEQWFGSLPENKQKYFSETGLNKVIEIHANTLYENGWDYYNQQHPSQPITQQEAKRVIALTFSCLTKIDGGRAVRNRMSLEEIASIINTPGFKAERVGAILDVYRDEGNSFIRPFKTEDVRTHHLSADTVLDITHESLIRNWNKLHGWASREYEFYANYLDFKKQLDRWKESGKSSNYLLPIGPLAFFENWYTECKPNVGWIRRYTNIHDDNAKATEEASVVLSDVAEFLRRSGRKVMITRAFMKYGAQRIATIAAILILLVLSGFYWYDAEQKENDRVLRAVQARASGLLESVEVPDQVKSRYIIIQERFEPGSMISYLQDLKIRNRIGLANWVYRSILLGDKHFAGSSKGTLIKLIEDSFAEFGFAADPAYFIAEHNKFVMNLIYDEYYNPGGVLLETLRRRASACGDYVTSFYQDKRLYKGSVPVELNLAIQHWLTFGNPSAADIETVINLVSPFASAQSKEIFDTYYQKGTQEPNGRAINDYAGGHHALACLYAAAGSVDGVLKIFDDMKEKGQMEYFNVPRVSFNNHLNVMGYFYLHNHRNGVPPVMKWLETNTSENPPETLLRNAAIRAGYLPSLFMINFFKTTNSYTGYFNLNLALAPRPVFNVIMDDLEATMRETKDADERNWLLAINAKRRAMFLSKYHFDRGLPQPQEELDKLFDRAMDHYRKVSNAYLDRGHSYTLIYYTDAVRSYTSTGRQLFIYPDYMEGWYSRPYHSDAFFQYLSRKNLLGEMYRTGEDLEMIHLWVAKAFNIWPDRDITFTNDFPLDTETLVALLDFVGSHPHGASFDRNLLTLITANKSFSKGDTTTALKYYRMINQGSLRGSMSRYEYLEKTYFMNALKTLAANLAQVNKVEEGLKLAAIVDLPDERIYTYMHMADKMFKKDYDPSTFVVLDSAMAMMKKINFVSSFTDPRYNLVELLSRIGGEEVNQNAMDVIRDMPANEKPAAIESMIYGVAWEGNYYRALTAIRPTFTESSDLNCCTAILWEACWKRDALTSNHEWETFDAEKDRFWDYINYAAPQ